jgi:hypothetical protein
MQRKYMKHYITKKKYRPITYTLNRSLFLWYLFCPDLQKSYSYLSKKIILIHFKIQVEGTIIKKGENRFIQAVNMHNYTIRKQLPSRFNDVRPYSPVEVYRRFGGMY